MVQTCAVRDCTNNWSPGCNISYYSFPKEVARRYLWLSKVPLKGRYYKGCKICSLHFRDEDYDHVQKRLKPTALPFYDEGLSHKIKIIRSKYRDAPYVIQKDLPPDLSKAKPRTRRSDSNKPLIELKNELPKLHNGPSESSDMPLGLDNSPSESNVECSDKDMSYTFASAFVKVEVNIEEDDNNTLPGNPLDNEDTRSVKVKQEVVDDISISTENPLDSNVTESIIKIELVEENSNSSGNQKPFESEENKVWVEVEVNNDSKQSAKSLKNKRETSSKRPKLKKRANRSTFKCDYCKFKTSVKKSLELHILGHNNSQQFSCDYCSYSTKYPTSLHRHVLIQHEFKKAENEELQKELPILNCDQCKYTTYFKWNLSAHRRKHFLENRFKCEICSYATPYRQKFEKHSKVHSKHEVEYKCDKCPFVTKFEGHITRHLAKIHNEISDKANKCDFCDFTTKVRWRLNVHKQRSKQKEVLKCSHCEFETIYMCESKKHRTCHYSEIYAKKRSRNDGSSTKINDPDKNTSDTFNDQDNLGASFYMNAYKTEDIIEMNEIQVRKTSNKEKPFQCEMCNYASQYKASVQRHFQRKHTPNRPFTCLNCEYASKTKDKIDLHVKRSRSATELSCKACNFVSYYKCHLTMHQKEHYTYKCNVCNYSYKNKYDLQKHISVIHLGHGLKCRFCDFRATRLESLQYHETIHTGDKPFKCQHCSYTSIRKTLLYKHMKKYHNDLITDDTVTIDDSKIESLKVKISDTVNQQALDIEEYIRNATQEIINCAQPAAAQEVVAAAQNMIGSEQELM